MIKKVFIEYLKNNNINFTNVYEEYIFWGNNLLGKSEFVIFDGVIANSDTQFWSEGYQMLSSYEGSFANPRCIARCPDNSDPYRITNDYGFCTTYNYLIFKIGDSYTLFGFTSCNKYQGAFRIYPNGRCQIIVDFWGPSVANNGELEKFCILEGSSIYDLKLEYSRLINKNHPKLSLSMTQTPKGWCSWYWYYADVTEQAIVENARNLKEFDDYNYVLIDDGYQTHMGDWLTFSERFSQGLPKLVNEINSLGKKVALWVAPFIVSSDSQLFRMHPDWLVKNRDGQPLKSADITYGGWRDGAWYMLDFSIKDVRDYIFKVFNYYYQELGIDFFKLDALYWGSIKGTYFKDNITAIENYRIGLQVISEATAGKAYILGCNAPLFPSLGLVHGMRLADDVVRDRERMVANINLLLHRLWMQENLYDLDPDCLCIKDLNSKLDPLVLNYHSKSFKVMNKVLMLGDRLAEFNLDDKNFLLELSAFIRDNYKITMQSEDCNTIEMFSDILGKKVQFRFIPELLKVEENTL